MRVVDALPAIRSSRFELPLTYDAGSLPLRIGEMVRVPLANREVLAFIVSSPRETGEPARPLKPVLERLDVPRAFDETGLHLARFMAERYLCTLGEALSAVLLADAIPRMRDSIVRLARPNPRRHSAVPARLIRLIWDELPESFALEQLLRHPEARRIADRGTLLAHVRALVRIGRPRARAAFGRPPDQRVSRARPRSRRRSRQRQEGAGAGGIRARASGSSTSRKRGLPDSAAL